MNPPILNQKAATKPCFLSPCWRSQNQRCNASPQTLGRACQLLRWPLLRLVPSSMKVLRPGHRSTTQAFDPCAAPSCCPVVPSLLLRLGHGSTKQVVSAWAAPACCPFLVVPSLLPRLGRRSTKQRRASWSTCRSFWTSATCTRSAAMQSALAPPTPATANHSHSHSRCHSHSHSHCHCRNHV